MKQILRRLRAPAAGAALVAVVALAGCGSSDDSGTTSTASGASSKKPVQFYASMALTGPFAAVGAATKAGLQAGVNQINATGGISGRKIEVKYVDDQGSATTAVSLLQKALTSGDKPDVVFNGNTSDVTLALCPILNRAGIISIGVTGSQQIDDKKLCGTTFSTTWDVTQWQATAAQYLKSKNAKNVGLIVTNDAYGDSAVDGTKAALPPAGITLQGTQSVTPDALDATAQLHKLVGDSPDALVMEANGAVIGHILDSRRKVNDTIPMLIGAGAASNNIRAFTSAASTKNVVLTAFSSMVAGKAPDPAKFDAAISQIKQQLGGPFKLTNIPYTLAYDVAFVTKEGMARANGQSGTALGKALETFGANPPSNPGWVSRAQYAFTPQSHFSKPSPTDFAMAEPTALDANGAVKALPAGQ
jgi:branched-chain amino acid transport system substrate-binding protein